MTSSNAESCPTLL